MKLWLDDIRPMPKGFDKHVTNVTIAKSCIAFPYDPVDEISFDHDLGEDNGTGYDVAKFIEEQAYLGNIPPIKWSIHSANPVGRKNIEAAMKKAEEYWGV